MHASLALQKGNWSKAYDLLASIKIWRLFPDTEDLLAMMRNQLQIEGLRTYIFTYKSVYSKLSIAKLSTIFALPEEKITEIVTKMGELVENGYINFSTAANRSKLQELAILMNEKIQLLTDKNEKTSASGHGKKQQPQQTTQQPQQTQPEENRFRIANVNINNDEFQITA